MRTDHPPPPSPDASPRYERLLASLEEGLWERNLLTGEAWYSSRFKRMLGFASNELPDDPTTMRLRVHPEDLSRLDAAVATATRGGTTGSFELRLLSRDGHWRWFRARLRVWPDDHGRPTTLIGTLLDIDAERRAALELERMSARFERAVAASDEGLFEAVWDRDEVQLSAHAAELVGLGNSATQASYAALRAQVHPDDLPRVRSEVATAVLALARWQVVYRARRFDQPERFVWFRERGTATRDPGGEIRVSGMLADVNDQVTSTERLEARVARRTAELADALKQADAQRAAAEGANRAKASFLGQMSHELRTPLNGVLGMLQLALHGAESEEQKRYLELARQTGDSLLRLVDDILDFARAEAGRLALRHEPFDLEALLVETFRIFIPAVRPKGLSMLFDLQGRQTHFVGDAGRLRQVVSNLVSNATKFTETGSVHLVAQVQEAGSSGLHDLAIEVRDTGPGMDADTARRVFEPFEQGDRSTSRRHGGTGLGLPIVRLLTERMGGQVEVETALGAGSTFRVRLALPADPQAPPRAPAPAPGTAWIVYRSAMGAAWLGRRIVREGWTTRTFESLAQLLQALVLPGPAGAAHPPTMPDAIVVSETALGDDDDFAGLVARLPAGVRVTLLLRPDFNVARTLDAAQRAGIGLAFAPLARADLLQVLSARGDPPPEARAPEPAALPAASLRRVMVVEDNALNRLIAHEMLRAIGVEAVLAESGEDALEACRREPPELVLMDIQMPGMDGLETARRLRMMQAEGHLPAFPIVALTAHAMPGDREASLQVGMNEHLTKPIQFRELQQVVQRYLPVAA